MKTFKQFQEAAFAIPAIAGASKFILPAAAATVGAIGTYLQARKYKTRNNPNARISKRKLGNMEKSYHKKEEGDRSNDMIVAKTGEAQKQNKLIDKYEKIQKSTENNFRRKNFIKKLKGDNPENQFNSYDPLKEEAPTNNVGGGQIAGTTEAGDDPPVKKGRKKKKSKKKRYIYGGTRSRRMWMKKNNK